MKIAEASNDGMVISKVSDVMNKIHFTIGISSIYKAKILDNNYLNRQEIKTTPEV